MKVELPSLPSTSDSPDFTYKPPSSDGRKRKAPPLEDNMEEAYHAFTFAEPESSDECSIYAELLAKKLRALDESTRGIAMLEIDHLMYRLKEKKIHYF